MAKEDFDFRIGVLEKRQDNLSDIYARNTMLLNDISEHISALAEYLGIEFERVSPKLIYKKKRKTNDTK